MRNRLGKFVTSTVAAIMLTVTFAVPASSAGGGFSDVRSGDFFAGAVDWMVAEGITNGTTPCTFSPNNRLSRAEAAVFIWRMWGSNDVGTRHGFSDVVESWQHGAVSWAKQKGVTKGTSASTFSPAAPVTRGQFAVMIWRLKGEPSGGGSHPFRDVPGWQSDAIAWMAANGITRGTTPTTFSPGSVVTRAEAAAFLHRLAGSPKAQAAASAAGCSGSGSGSSGQVIIDGSMRVTPPSGTLGPRTGNAVNPASVSGISFSGGAWVMNRDWDETRDGGYLNFGSAALRPNGHKVLGFRIQVPSSVAGGHVIDSGGEVGYFEISNPAQHAHNSYIRHGIHAHHYKATGVVGDAIKVGEGSSNHHDAYIEMDVRPGGSSDKHYDGVQVFGSGSLRLERVIIEWNNAGTIANTTGALFTQDSASLYARDILVRNPGGTWQPVRLSGSRGHDVDRIQVVGSRQPNNNGGKLAPNALVKITNGSGRFTLFSGVAGVDAWLIE